MSFTFRDIEMTLIYFVFLFPLLLSKVQAENIPLFDLTRLRLLDPPEAASVGIKIIANQSFNQKIDHFNPTDTRVWKQRYHINEDYYNENSKSHVFLMLGGEWEATTNWMSSGAWIKSAKEYGALLFYLEHRYYGQSHPFKDLSTENLQYLNAHQALEDAANFITGMNEKYNIDTTEAKWIVFGGSYAGTLASWMRQKYPHLVAGAVDSSGPLEAKLDFHEYFQVVRNNLRTYNDSCVNNIKEAFTELEEIVGGCLEDTAVYEKLNSMFSLCSFIELSEGNEKDLSSFFETLASSNFAYIVQYSGLISISINDVCNVMIDESIGTPLQRLAQVNSLMLQYFSQNCTSYNYEKMVTYYQNTAISTSSMARQWYYQTCTEYGFYQTTSQEDSIFGSRFKLSFFTDLCSDIFGSQFNEEFISRGIEATNVRYGGVNAPVSKVVHVHGRVDPWHALGKLETTDDIGDSVIIVDGVSHCANMYETSTTDSADLEKARAEIDRLIGEWLGVPSKPDSASSIVASLYVLSIGFIIYLVN
ncbi:putative serine protease K12H4.7 [Euwallacea fornicatus]|uniref:putative serine protease K12H4.7 n=1 Tax=Euwallacea fornicatus TaxID=995702 RepID=UPI00338F4FAA